jgi:hypothetical protein
VETRDRHSLVSLTHPNEVDEEDERHYLLLTAHYLLLTAYYLGGRGGRAPLLTTYYLLYTA